MMHAVREIILFVVSHLVVVLSFATGLATEPRLLAQNARRPVVVRAMLVALLGVPALAIAVVKLIPLGPLAAAAIVLMGVSPGVPFLIKAVRKQHGNVPLAIVLSLLLSLAAVVYVPVALEVVHRLFPKTHLRVSASQVFAAVLPGVLAPVALGLAIRHFAPRVADRLAPVVDSVFKGMFVVALVVALLVGLPALRKVNGSSLLALLIITTGGALLGHLAGGRDPEDRTAVAIASVMGNPAIALLIARTSYPDAQILPVICAYVLLRAAALVPYQVWGRSHDERERRPPRGAEAARA